MIRASMAMPAGVVLICVAAHAGSPFAAEVVDYSPAPGQFVNDAQFNNPARALGPPVGGGTLDPNQSSVVSLGGFGGSITLRFDHTVRDHAANPLGLDAIVFGNAHWIAGNHNRHWAEAATIEICRDDNANGEPDPDEPWYLIPGSHLPNPASAWQVQTWDVNTANATYPPADAAWIPPGSTGQWQTGAFRLPTAIFDVLVVQNPNGLGSTDEGIFGYADYSPTLALGDLDGDNLVDDPTMPAESFYVVPDDPLTTGIDPGSCGGDAFDIAWAVDPDTNAPANLDGFDFIRITTAVNRVLPGFGEMSTEIDAVADVATGLMGDTDFDGDVDLSDFAAFVACIGQSPISGTCGVVDFDDNGAIDFRDFAVFQTAFSGAM